MAQVGSSNEPLTETAGFAYTGSLWVPVSCDASGNLNVIAGAGSFADALNKGYIGSAWQNDPIRYGYSAVESEIVTDTNAGAGFQNLTGTTVPAGEIWVIENMFVTNVTRAFTYTSFRGIIDGNAIFLHYSAGAAAGIPAFWGGRATLGPGDNTVVKIGNCTAGDTISMGYNYVRIDIDQ